MPFGHFRGCVLMILMIFCISKWLKFTQKHNSDFSQSLWNCKNGRIHAICLKREKYFPQMLTSIILIHLSLDNVISITDGQRLLLLAKLNWDRRALNTIWLSPYGVEGLFRKYHNYANLIAFYYLGVQSIPNFYLSWVVEYKLMHK